MHRSLEPIRGCVVGLAAALRLLRAPQLRELHLQRSRVGDGFGLVVEALPCAPALEVVFAMQNSIGDAAMSAFGRLAGAGGAPAVRQLGLQNNKIGDEGARTLAAALLTGALPGLQWLYLGENSIGDEGAVPLV